MTKAKGGYITMAIVKEIQKKATTKNIPINAMRKDIGLIIKNHNLIKFLGGNICKKIQCRI